MAVSPSVSSGRRRGWRDPARQACCLGEEAALAVLHSYLREGAQLIRLSGQFCAAVWDAAREEIALVIDLLGTRPLYLAEQEGLVLAASELKALLAAGFEPRLDLDGAAQLLAYEHLLAASTPLAGVRLLPPASTTVVGPTGIRTIDRGRYRVAPASRADVADSVSTFARLLDSATFRRRESTTALALSGGLDSRCLASIVGVRWPASRSFTFASPGTEEGDYAARVAAATDLEHHLVQLEPGYIARGAAETVWLSEGQIRCFHSHHLVLRDVRPRFGVTSLLVGTRGCGSPGRAPGRGARCASRLENDRLRRPPPRAIGCRPRRHAARAPTRPGASRASCGAGRARRSRACSRNSTGPTSPAMSTTPCRRFTGARCFRGPPLRGRGRAPGPVRGLRPPPVPLAHLPMPLRMEHPLQRLYLGRFPELARVPNTKDGIPPSLDGWRRTVAGKVIRVRRGVRVGLDRPLRRAGLPPRRGYSDYTVHLRNDMGRRLLWLLLEERTLDRGQLRRDPSELVDETLAGSARHTQALGVLLTLELFQRQFLDGFEPGERRRLLGAGKRGILRRRRSHRPVPCAHGRSHRELRYTRARWRGQEGIRSALAARSGTSRASRPSRSTPPVRTTFTRRP